MKNIMFLLILLLAVVGVSPSSAHPEQQMEQQHADHDEHAEEAGVHIDDSIARQAGIAVAQAGSGQIEQHISLYGELVIPPQRQASVHARYAGIVTQMRVSVGDSVSKGQVLAQVESDDSLRSYPLLAPISGVVVQQFVSVGGHTGSTAVLQLADSSKLWAELKVFAAALNEVKSGLVVHVEGRSGRTDSQIAHLVPANGAPYMLARAELDNSDGRFAPGERVSTLVDARVLTLPLVVNNSALQQLQGQTVVFVQDGNRYQSRPLKLGRTDGNFSEVLSGLSAGEHYVVANSYLIKAEMEKSAAGHDH